MDFEAQLAALMQTAGESPKADTMPELKQLKGKVETLDDRMKRDIERIERDVNAAKGRKIDRTDLTPNLADFLDKLNEARPVRIEIPQLQHIAEVDDDSKHIANFQKMVDDLLLGNNIFLVGPAGTGKTQTAIALCRALWGNPSEFMIELGCSQWTAPRDIVGGDTIDGYKEGRLIEAWRDGKLLVLDELPKLDPNTAGLFNDALAKSAIVSTPSKPVTIRSGDNKVYEKHPRFAVVATGNITGKRSSPKYKGNNTQDGSLIDRFVGSYYYVGYNEALEASLTHPFVFRVYKAMRDALKMLDIENDITLRGMLNGNRTFILEMERKAGFLTAVKGGKTFLDSIDSYLSLHDEDTRKLLERKVSTELTMLKTNNYGNVAEYQAWRKNNMKIIEKAKIKEN